METTNLQSQVQGHMKKALAMNHLTEQHLFLVWNLLGLIHIMERGLILIMLHIEFNSLKSIECKRLEIVDIFLQNQKSGI